ncbi:hypothetical protein V6Z11_A05G254600 [Gossypium hirsutum]
MGLDRTCKEFALLSLKLTIIATWVAAQPKPECQSNCGDISIPYPFGTGNGCNISSNFFIRCDTTSNPPKTFLSSTDIEVLHISLDGYLRIQQLVGFDCYNSLGRSSYGESFSLLNFPISNTRNKFTAIGCDTYALIEGTLGHTYSTGCVTFCSDVEDVINGSCSGIGCCQAAIPKGVRNYVLNFDTRRNHSNVLDFNPCSYGFVVEDGAYNFSVSDLSNENSVCIDPENYSCKENTSCINPGYLCKCLDGFQGNPYLSYGCQDIDECGTLKPCNETATCYDVAGSYYCSCPEGFEGDGQKNGTGCSPKVKSHQSIGILFSLLCSSWVSLGLRQRKLNKLKQDYFQQNATNNYHESKILGRGGQGTVYKGLLPDGCSVAIKKSIIGDQIQVQQFVNEVIVLSQINHRNVVKLLGCCLETQVPLLVYEYVSNGSVFDHLHNADHESFISWEARLKIATEAAEALSYLHSAASPPIIHRDVKLANILLDENYNAKVSDFGASRLVPSNKEQITTLVRGTLGYLDPEYFQTSQLTEKSDVYSFGVVLIELLTGLKAISFERPEHERNLTLYFIAVMKEERLLGDVKLKEEEAEYLLDDFYDSYNTNTILYDR